MKMTYTKNSLDSSLIDWDFEPELVNSKPNNFTILFIVVVAIVITTVAIYYIQHHEKTPLKVQIIFNAFYEIFN